MRIVSSEKALKLIEIENKIIVEVDRKMKKEDIKKQFEEIFGAKIISINIQIKKNKKIAYVKLNKNSPAIDIATQVGLI